MHSNIDSGGSVLQQSPTTSRNVANEGTSKDVVKESTKSLVVLDQNKKGLANWCIPKNYKILVVHQENNKATDLQSHSKKVLSMEYIRNF